MIQLYSLAVFLTGNVREAASTVRAKNAPWKSSASWRRNNLACRLRWVLKLSRTREKWAVPVYRQWYCHSAWQTGRRYSARRWRFRSARNAYSFRCHRQPTGGLTFALLVPADQTKTHLHTLSLVAKRLADKTICRRLRAAQSDEELYQIITDTEGTPDEA